MKIWRALWQVAGADAQFVPVDARSLRLEDSQGQWHKALVRS
jgi:hypothetical protein